MYCWSCHCDREGNFCRYCGAKLIGLTEIQCECGKIVDLNDFYCSNCGKQFTADWIMGKLEEGEYESSKDN